VGLAVLGGFSGRGRGVRPQHIPTADYFIVIRAALTNFKPA